MLAILKNISVLKESFKQELLESAEVLRKDGIVLFETFITTGPFSSEWSAKEALDYLGNIRAQLTVLREKEAQIARDLAIFGLSLPESQELLQIERVFNPQRFTWMYLFYL